MKREREREPGAFAASSEVVRCCRCAGKRHPLPAYGKKSATETWCNSLLKSIYGIVLRVGLCYEVVTGGAFTQYRVGDICADRSNMLNRTKVMIGG